jgi:hypothetical protein
MHIAVARRIITFLEDRRVLYNPYHMEDPRHCIQSVIEIRQFLTAELSNLSGDEELVQNLLLRFIVYSKMRGLAHF